MSSSSSCKDLNRSSNNSAPDGMFYHRDSYIKYKNLTSVFVCVVLVGEEGMEIKRQITGMMRLLSDRSGRVYQRVSAEQDSATKEPQGRHLSWPQEPAPLPRDHQGNSWNSAGDPEPSPLSITVNPLNGPGCGQQGTGSKAKRPKETKEPNKVHESHGRTELRRRNLIS